MAAGRFFVIQSFSGEAKRKIKTKEGNKMREWANNIDRQIARWMDKYCQFLMRISLALIFIWFGALKPLGLSPEEEQALERGCAEGRPCEKGGCGASQGGPAQPGRVCQQLCGRPPPRLAGGHLDVRALWALCEDGALAEEPTSHAVRRACSILPGKEMRA